jgi:transcriptional regulator with XRE-family HTH domain
MTPALIRAARGLLGWQQQELADKAGLSLSAVNNYEREIGSTRQTTINAMIATLEEAGIEFLPNGGLRHSDEISGVQRFSGNNFISKMNEDMYTAIRKPGQEIFTCSADESQWHTQHVKESTARYYKWRTQMAASESILVAEGNNVFDAPRQHYRFLPAELIGKITYVIYTDRIAFITWRKKQVFILRSRQLVEPFREQFKYLWRMAKKA